MIILSLDPGIVNLGYTKVLVEDDPQTGLLRFGKLLDLDLVDMRGPSLYEALRKLLERLRPYTLLLYEWQPPQGLFVFNELLPLLEPTAVRCMSVHIHQFFHMQYPGDAETRKQRRKAYGQLLMEHVCGVRFRADAERVHDISDSFVQLWWYVNTENDRRLTIKCSKYFTA